MTADGLVMRLMSQLSRGEPVLFLGAGFSLDACDTKGRTLPSSKQLAREFWDVAFPSDPFEADTQLGDAYESARLRNPHAVSALIQDRLSVDSGKLPSHYANWLSLPWARCYTPNFDDLEQAVARRYSLERTIRSISATSGRAYGGNIDALEVIHLNGMIGDPLEALTFSDLQRIS